MTNLEQEQRNVREAIEGAREDWLAADNELDRDRQMLAIDALLDVGIQIGAFALHKTIDISPSV